MFMSDTYSYILAELLKRNTELHGKELAKRGNYQRWTDDMKKVIVKELCKYPRGNNKLKAYAGYIWGQLMRQQMYTREIYQLLLQWALLLTENNLLFFYTKDYEDIINELRERIEEGAEGIHIELSPEEIIAEWESMKTYLPGLHDMCEEWESKDK